jgi:hypothetical protein
MPDIFYSRNFCSTENRIWGLRQADRAEIPGNQNPSPLCMDHKRSVRLLCQELRQPWDCNHASNRITIETYQQSFDCVGVDRISSTKWEFVANCLWFAALQSSTFEHPPHAFCKGMHFKWLCDDFHAWRQEIVIGGVFSIACHEKYF